MESKLTRTFHAVGHGAFYTERHFFNNTEFTVVYDCGSMSIKAVDREKKIELAFPKGHSIDILFISHFHADHINGIKFLVKNYKIKKVVLPLVDNQTKVLLKVENFINHDFLDTLLINNPEEFFGNDIIIIKVKPTEINPNTDEVALDNPVYLSEISKSRTITSGTVLSPYVGIDWIFIPLNYEYNERKKIFEDALKIYNLTFDDIDIAIRRENKKKKNDIIEAYKSVTGDLNQNSMILYSGKKSSGYICCLDRVHDYHVKIGCLYMGDINLKKEDIVLDINAKLKKVLPFIGTLQIPHHGSDDSFNISILPPNMCCAIFSFGKNNNHGHPSQSVVFDIEKKFIFPHLVTEDTNSTVVQMSQCCINYPISPRGYDVFCKSSVFSK
jgi:hypothetical protein